MLFDVQIDDQVKKVQYRKLLFKQEYSVGRSIKNDLVILDKEIPLFWKKIKRVGFKYKIFDKAKQLKNKHKFCINIEYSRLFYLLCIVFSASIAYGLHNYFFSSDLEIAYTQKTYLPTTSAFGVLDDNDHVKQHLKFYFDKDSLSKGIDQYLHFTAGNIYDAGEVEVYVNTQLIGYVQASPGSWGKEQRLRIPKKIIQQNLNTLDFKLNRLENKDKKWGVRNIYIENKTNNSEYDVGVSEINEYFTEFLKLPSPDATDYKRVLTMQIKYNQLKTKQSPVAGQADIERILKKITTQYAQFLKAQSLERKRHEQLIKHSIDEYGDYE